MTQGTSEAKKQEFTGLRAIFWPIHSHELKKFIPMGLMMFCILLIYTVLRDTKDALIATAPGAGAESFSFIKGIGVTTSAILFMLIYTKAANIFEREGLFYITAAPFLIFFGCFAFLIFPNKELFHMSLEQIQTMQAEYPRLFWIIPLIGNWTFTVFYIFSELWGSAVLSLLFWQFANAITPVSEAKRFYGLFGLVGNFGLLLSGPAVIYFSRMTTDSGLSVDAAWGLSLKYLMGMVVVAGILLYSIFYWMNRNVLTDKRYYDPEAMGETKKKNKPKLSFTESLRYIASSPYLGLIALLVLCYGVSINVFEGVWKGQIKIATASNPNEFNVIMGYLSLITGSLTICLMLVGSNILRRFSWRTAALITPIIMLTGILIFFGVIYYNNLQTPIGMKIEAAIAQGLVHPELVLIAVIVGLCVNAFGKAVKYSLFDPTKEMAYIPLDPELKVKGKAAVDVIGGRGGKSGGSYVQMGLLTTFAGSALYQLVPIIAPIAVGVVLIWIMSIFRLSTRFQALTSKGDKNQSAKAAA